MKRHPCEEKGDTHEERQGRAFLLFELGCRMNLGNLKPSLKPSEVFVLPKTDPVLGNARRSSGFRVPKTHLGVYNTY